MLQRRRIFLFSVFVDEPVLPEKIIMTILRGLCEFQLNEKMEGVDGQTQENSDSWSNWNFKMSVVIKTEIGVHE